MDYPISELHIEGYRSLNNVTWRLGPVNVMIGPNASGKSNLLKALSLIAASARGRLQDFIDEDGGMGSILWNGAGRIVAFRVTFKSEQPISQTRLVTYESSLVRMGQTASYRIGTEELARWYKPDDKSVEQRESILKAPDTASDAPVDPNPNPPMYRPSHGTVETELSERTYEQHLYKEVTTLRSDLESWLVLDDLTLSRASKVRGAATARFIERLDSDGGNLSSVLHTLYTSSSEFREQIKDAMFAAFGNEFVELVFPPAGGQTQIQLAIQWKSIKNAVTTTDLSDGTLRFLAIIAALAHPNPGALIAIDEPETGLHPRMMRIIAEYARNAALKSQVIFTTHSAAFLDSFDRQEPPTTAVVEMEGGATSVRTLDSEELRRWLSDYTLGSLYTSMQLDQISAGASGAE